MKFLTECKGIAAAFLTAWQFVPSHFQVLRKQLANLSKGVCDVVLRCLAIAACCVAPFLFFLAPLIVPLQRRSLLAQEAARQRALGQITDMTRRRSRHQRVSSENAE